LPTFNSAFCFDERLRSLETSFSEYRQTSRFVDDVSAIPGIVHQYMTQQMIEAVRETVQIQTDRLQDLLQRENDEFLRNINENMKKIIKGQVKNQVKEQVSRILPRIEESVNATLEAEVLTQSSHSSRTSYAIAADLSEMELKKIFIEKIEGNKSIQRSNEQRNLYKALVEAYDADKAILDIYGESTILKRRREDDDLEGPSAGSDRGSKRQKEGGEHASASTPSETATRVAGKTTKGSQSRQLSAIESAFVEEPVQTTCQMEEPPHPPRRPPLPDRDWNKTLLAAQGDAQSWISDLARQTDARSSFNELLDIPIDFSNFIMNRLNVDTLTLELLDGPTYELMKESCNSLTELEYHLEEVYKATTDQLDWVNPEGQQYPHNLLQPLPLIPNNRDYGHIKWIEDLVPRAMWIQQPIDYNRHALWGVSHWGRKRKQFYGYAVNQESALDVYSKRRIIAVTELKIVEWHDYKHLDCISVRRDDDKIYKFKEGDLKRLRLQDIEDMLLLLEHCHPEASGRSSTGSGKLLEEAQPHEARHVLTRSEATDGTLNDVRNALDDRLKGIRMQYLLTTIWRRGDKDRAAAMIQAIEKMLKIKRIMRSLEKFVGGRLHRRYVTASGSRKANKSDGRRTLCFQRLFKNVHKKHHNPKAYGRPSTRCRKLPKEAQLTKPDTYHSDLKRKEAYTTYFNPRGFIYQNKDKQNRLMRINELHKFSDGTLNDVRTALDDRIKGIRMKYLPQTI
nr:hypothetical protein [Tanacetum cinerariifolium]